MSANNPTGPSRPLGVAILAVLIGLFGLLWIVIGLFLLGGASLHGYEAYGANPAIFHQTGLVAGVIVLLLGLIVLGLALGLWHLRMWALALTLIVLIVVLASYVIAGNIVSLGFAISLILLIYLAAVHQHFR